MSSFPHLAVCLKGCVSERLSVSWKDCLSLWRTVCLVKGLSVFWKDCLSFGGTVCLSEGLSVCFSKELAPYLKDCFSEGLSVCLSVSLKDFLSIRKTVCLSEGLSVYLFICGVCLSLRFFSVCLSTCLCMYVCQSFWAPLSASIRHTCYVCPSVAVS